MILTTFKEKFEGYRASLIDRKITEACIVFNKPSVSAEEMQTFLLFLYCKKKAIKDSRVKVLLITGDFADLERVSQVLNIAQYAVLKEALEMFADSELERFDSLIGDILARHKVASIGQLSNLIYFQGGNWAKHPAYAEYLHCETLAAEVDSIREFVAGL